MTTPSSTSAKPSPTSPKTPRRRIWSDSAIAQLTEGVMEDEKIQQALRTRDARGLDPVAFAALRTARTTQDLTALLALLDPPQAEEKGQLDQVLDLLTAIAEAVARIEQRQVALESRLAVRSAASPTPLRPVLPSSPR